MRWLHLNCFKFNESHVSDPVTRAVPPDFPYFLSLRTLMSDLLRVSSHPRNSAGGWAASAFVYYHSEYPLLLQRGALSGIIKQLRALSSAG